MNTEAAYSMKIKHVYVLTLSLIMALSISAVAQEVVLSPVRVYDEGFKYPSDLVGNERGDVFVLDAVNDRVVVIKTSGEVAEIRPQRDSFYKAVGIAVVDDKLWIADTPRSRLLQMGTDGRIRQVIKLEHGTEPVDLVAIGKNKVISDRKNHTITVLDENDREKYYWGTKGSKVGEFLNPGFLAAGPENKVIIGDILNRRVIAYSQSGRFPNLIAKPGIEQGQIFRPKGIVVDAENRIWVADGYTGAIQVFSASGKYVGVAASEDGEVLSLDAPMGIWFDKKGQLWVVESYSSKVSVWKVK